MGLLEEPKMGQRQWIRHSAFWLLLLLSILVSISLANAQVFQFDKIPAPPKLKKLLGLQAAHGWLLWASAGFLLPLGVIVIRMSKTATENGVSTKTLATLYYVHVALQVLGVGLSIIGGFISFKISGPSLRLTHRRLGIALYILMWILPLTGFFRPNRGTPTRRIWYFSHWILGTGTIVLGLINNYIGIAVYESHSAKSMRTYNILYSIQLSILGVIYLFQDRWAYMMEQSKVSKLVTPKPITQLLANNNQASA